MRKPSTYARLVLFGLVCFGLWNIPVTPAGRSYGFYTVPEHTNFLVIFAGTVLWLVIAIIAGLALGFFVAALFGRFDRR